MNNMHVDVRKYKHDNVPFCMRFIKRSELRQLEQKVHGEENLNWITIEF